MKNFLTLIINWWTLFFDKGLIDEKQLKIVWENSKYNKENQHEWLKLYYFDDLEDSEFINVLKVVEKEFQKKKYKDIGIIKHIVGTFLVLSENCLYSKSKSYILREAKEYIDYLQRQNHLNLAFNDDNEVYGSLTYRGKAIKEFHLFSQYINNKIKEEKTKKLPDEAETLLELMNKNPMRYKEFISINSNITYIHDSNINYVHIPINNYHDLPIFTYVNVKDYFEILLNKNTSDKRTILYSLKKRYDFVDVYNYLADELDFIQKLKQLVYQHYEENPSQLSSYTLYSLAKSILPKIIDKLIKINNNP